MTQLSIKKPVRAVGIGIHKGEPIELVLEPAAEDTGIVFCRSDLGEEYPARPGWVINTQMATVLGSSRAYVSTIEHLMSALAAYGIDNVRVSLNSLEVPIMDGSAISFCMLLDEAGIQKQKSPKKIIKIKRSVEVREGDKYARLSPSKNVSFDFEISFKNPLIGSQAYHFDFSKQNYIEEIARARTFGFLRDVEALRARGLALGGSLENAIILDENKVLNPEGLRFRDEFVRHKILDAIGDLALLGHSVFGKYEAFAGSHKLNHLLTKAVLADEKNYELVSLKDQPGPSREADAKRALA